LTNEHSRQAFFKHFLENFKVILKAFFSEANPENLTLPPENVTLLKGEVTEGG
jgi:hypothetical protein